MGAINPRTKNQDTLMITRFYFRFLTRQNPNREPDLHKILEVYREPQLSVTTSEPLPHDPVWRRPGGRAPACVPSLVVACLQFQQLHWLVKLVSERKIKKRFQERQLKPGKLHRGVTPRQLSLSHPLPLFLPAECCLGGTCSVWGQPGWAARGHLGSRTQAVRVQLSLF